MRNFRKRTIALCLASAITVLGSFASETYQNSIVSLRIDSGSYGTVNITAFTKTPYDQGIRMEQVDENNYNIIFPEVDSKIESMPYLGQYENIDNINVATFPYLPGQEGYTRISIKTKGSPTVNAITSLYIPDNQATEVAQIPTESAKKSETPQKVEQEQEQKSSYWSHHTNNQQGAKELNTESKATNSRPTSFKKNKVKNQDYSNYNDMPNNSSSEKMPIVIGLIVLAFIILFIVFLNKDKMAAIVGDQKDLDFDDNDEPKKNKSKSKKIRSTIKKLDNQYKNTPSSSKVNIVTGQSLQEDIQTIDKTPEEPQKETVVVDLDSLYNEKAKNEQSVNTSEEKSNDEDDLAAFLDEFAFDETPQEEENSFDEELYENTINNENLNFSKNDSSRLNLLLQNEISDDTLNNIEEYAPKEPLPKHVPTEMEKLENILAEYTIKQNLSFSKDDVDTIRKLINVELDDKFITDLRTNPQKTIEMQKELQNKEKKPHKTSEMLVLNVKDLLPDLSKEVKKQGNKKIESNAKPEVIYYSEGYEVNKLSVSSDLANISKAVHDKNATKFRPSDDIPVVENGYDVQTLSIKDQLPDLADYKINPLKYESKKSTEKVDENALLNSIANVQFKPFYEDIQEEFSQFENFEIIDNEEIEKKADEQNLIELQKYNQALIQNKKPKQTQKTNDDAQKLLDLISEKQAEKENKKLNISQENVINETTNPPKQETINNSSTPDSCEIEGISYNIVKLINCGNGLNCILAKNNNGYDVIGQLNETYTILKHYDSLKSENIQTRVSETLLDGSVQYLVRIGIHKFVFNVSGDKMEFVMDLC